MNLQKTLAEILRHAQGAHRETEEVLCPQMTALLEAQIELNKALEPIAEQLSKFDQVKGDLAMLLGAVERIELYLVARHEDYPLTQRGVVDLEERKALLAKRLRVLEDTVNGR